MENISGSPTRFILWLLAWFHAIPAGADSHFQDAIIRHPTPVSFSVCYDHSCASVATDSLTEEEWRRATVAFSGVLANAADEREAIADTIATLEFIVGEHLGTSGDKGGNLKGFGQPKQLDCIDESSNTHTYLRMLEGEGLFRFHTVVRRRTRFGIFVGMPHTTAVIRENESGVHYAVDSWFFDNGQAPYIVKLEDWKSGKDPY